MDFALASNGASVMMATANDDNHPSENVLDGKDDTFWTTTGLFPHEVIIKLSKRESISKVRPRQPSQRFTRPMLLCTVPFSATRVRRFTPRAVDDGERVRPPRAGRRHGVGARVRVLIDAFNGRVQSKVDLGAHRVAWAQHSVGGQLAHERRMKRSVCLTVAQTSCRWSFFAAVGRADSKQ